MVPSISKCRSLSRATPDRWWHVLQVLPCSGNVSISVWDAPSIQVLQDWLDENLNQDATHYVSEAVEEFAAMGGFALELSRARAAEKLAAGSRTTYEKLSQTASMAGDRITEQVISEF